LIQLTYPHKAGGIKKKKEAKKKNGGEYGKLEGSFPHSPPTTTITIN
jgi:hypothetical protein